MQKVLYFCLRSLLEKSIEYTICGIDRSMNLGELLSTAAHVCFNNGGSARAAPRQKSRNVTIVFFKPKKKKYSDFGIRDDEVAKEYQKRGLIPDPFALAWYMSNEYSGRLSPYEDNQSMPVFDGKCFVACQWKNRQKSFRKKAGDSVYGPSPNFFLVEPVKFSFLSFHQRGDERVSITGLVTRYWERDYIFAGIKESN